MKAQILSLLFLAIGFGAGYQWSNMKTQNSQLKPTVAHDEKDFYKTKYETLTTKFQALSDQEIESYINESDPSLKGSKADAMLTKLMKLFLVDIGLRLSEQNKRFQDSKFKYSSVTQKTETAKKFEKPVCEYTKQTCEERFGKITEKVAQINWQNKELGLASVNSVSQMSDFLKDVEVPNLFNYLSSAKVIDQNSYKFFSGNFEGELTFDNKKKKKLTVETSIKNLNFESKKASADFEFYMYQDGKQVSRSYGDGGIKSIKTFAHQSQGFILQISPNTNFHLYTNKSNTILFGNVYQKKTVSEYIKVGKVLLYRKN